MVRELLNKTGLITLLMYYLMGIICVYFSPSFISLVYFLALLIFFWNSKHDYFWFVLIFFFVDAPGGLFPISSLNYSLPQYNIFPGGLRNIFFQELFILIALIKAIKYKHHNEFPLQKPLILLFSYFFILYFLSIYYGMSPIKHFRTIRMLLPWTMLYSISMLMPNRTYWIPFFKLLFPLVFLILGIQIIHLIIGKAPALLLGSSTQNISEIAKDVTFSSPQQLNDMIRPISSSFIVLACFIGSMFFISFQWKYFKMRYLYMILITSFFSIFLTATRGWIIAFSVTFIFYVLFLNKSSSSLTRIITPIIIFLFISFSIPGVNNQISKVYNRLSTVASIAEGDYTAEGTLARIDTYTPELLSVWEKNKLFGWGFSDTFFENSNGHAGMPNLLMQVGIIGMLIFLYFWWVLFYRPIVINKFLSKKNPYKSALPVMSLYFLTFLILHSSSGQQFQYLIGFGFQGFGQLIYLALLSFFITDAINTERQIRSQRITYVKNS